MDSENKSFDRWVFKTVEDANEYYASYNFDEKDDDSSILIEKNNGLFRWNRGDKDKDSDYGDLKWRSTKSMEQTMLSPTVADLFRVYLKAQTNAERHKREFLDMVKVVNAKELEEDKRQIVTYGKDNVVIIESFKFPLGFDYLPKEELKKMEKEIENEYGNE